MSENQETENTEEKVDTRDQVNETPDPEENPDHGETTDSKERTGSDDSEDSGEEDNSSSDEDNESSESEDSDSEEEGEGDFDQSDIDAMLSNQFANSEKSEKSGIERIIKTGFVSYERMPMLENVFDRLCRFLSTRLRGYTNDNVDVTDEDMKSLRFGDFMSSVPTSSVFAVFKAEQWGNYGLFVIDDALAYSIINILMGGDKETLQIAKNRPLTNLERDLVKSLILSVLYELKKAFTPIDDVDFVFDRIEVSSSLAAIVRPSNASVATRFHIDLGNCSGNLDLLLPFSTLEPVRDKLSQQFTGEFDDNDNIWETHLLSEIVEAHVFVNARFNKTEMKLSDVLAIKKGSVIRIPVNSENKFAVTLECDDIAIGDGTLGRKQNHYAVNIDKRLLPPEEELTKENIHKLIEAEHDR